MKNLLGKEYSMDNTDLKASRVKVKVWRASGNGKPQSPTPAVQKKSKILSNGDMAKQIINIGKSVRGTKIPNLLRAKGDVKTGSSIFLAAERLRAKSDDRKSGESASNKKSVLKDLISKFRKGASQKRMDPDADNGVGASGLAAEKSSHSGKPLKESRASTNDLVGGRNGRADTADNKCKNKTDEQFESNRTKQEDGGEVVVSMNDDDSKEKLPLNKETVSTNGKSAREGWLSPKYRESKKVKLDYQTAARHRCVCLFPDLPYVEHYKMLRTQIQQRCGEKGWNTIMVTSVNPSEGKTVTAINLSVVLAKEYDQTVLLVDADLRNQQVHKYMGYQEPHSLVDYLETDMSLSDVIVWPGVEKLTVISGESTVNDSTEILGSPRMSSLVEEMKTRYPKRYIIFDVPPVLDHADATSFAPLVDAILVVMEPGRTNLKDVLKMTELLPKEKIIGYAMNRYMQ
jgi:non-specific protein-tyrosine kinase